MSWNVLHIVANRAYTIHMSRETLVLEFLGSKLSTNQIAGFFKWSLLVNENENIYLVEKL